MNGLSDSTDSRAQRVQTILCIALLFTAVSVDAAEYSEADDIPAVTSLMFTESSIALTVVRHSSGYRPADRTTYFVADRGSYSFQEISEQEFHSLTMEEHVRESTREYTELGIDLSSTEDCKNKGYRYDSGDHDMTGRMILQLPSTAIEFEMLCRSSVSSAVSIDDSVWIGTYTSGGHGDYGAEGVLVVPKNGDSVVRLNIGRDIVKNLRDFARLDEAELDELDLNEALKSTVEILRHEIEARQILLKTCFGDLPPVVCRPGRIHQVFHNLLLNAIQASAPMGTIEVGTAIDHDEVLVDVQDQGCGIEATHLTRIFEPFFTTKPVGRGTGLGLATCYGIIRDHGGLIEVDSQVGRGSTFRVRLPVRPTEAQDTKSS